MGADDRGVDHHVFGVGVAGQAIQNTIENAALAPSAEALVGAFPGTKMPRQIAPGNARPIAVENRVNEQEMSVWNGHYEYECTCYHPLFVFNQFGDLTAEAIRVTERRYIALHL